MVRLRLYASGEGGKALGSHEMKRGQQGTWTAAIGGNLEGQYYTFQVKTGGEWMTAVPDPYAVAVGVNGLRGMVLNWESTHPEGWENDKSPDLASPNDIILYELHVRDMSRHQTSGIKQN